MGKGSCKIAPVVAMAKTTAPTAVKHTMSAVARRKIAAFQRALGEAEGRKEDCLE
jgi:hypothetical protein